MKKGSCCTLVSIAIFLGNPFASTNASINSQDSKAFSTVIIDAGHGGDDSGGSGKGLREKDLTLDTALRVRSALKKSGLQTVMVRENDRFVDLDDRVALANKYAPNAVLVSIHYNASGDRSAKGTEVYYWKAKSYPLGVRIASRMASNTGLQSKSLIRRVLRLTRNPEIPGILCECAYLTNGSDSKLVAQPNFRQKIADAIADGIIDEYQKGDVGIAPVAAEPLVPMSHKVTKSATKSKKSRPRKHRLMKQHHRQ